LTGFALAVSLGAADAEGSLDVTCGEAMAAALSLGGGSFAGSVVFAGSFAGFASATLMVSLVAGCAVFDFE
jgi:hypothetical protein